MSGIVGLLGVEAELVGVEIIRPIIMASAGWTRLRRFVTLLLIIRTHCQAAP
jgi:hypothetical protein